MEKDIRLCRALKLLKVEVNRDDWSPENVRQIVKGLRRKRKPKAKDFDEDIAIVINKMLHMVCRLVNRTRTSLSTKTREGGVVYGRQLVMFMLISEYHQQTKLTGNLFNKDHATAIYSRHLIQGLIDVDDKQTIEDLKLIKEYLK